MSLRKVTFPFPNIRAPEIESIIEPFARKRFYPVKSIFIRANDVLHNMYYIRKGETRHYTISDKGIEKIIYILSSGWFFGEPSLYLNVRTGLHALAETDLELWEIEHSVFRKLLDNSPELRDQVNSCLTYKVLFLRHEAEVLSLNSCEDRLMRVICMCTDSSYVIDGSWYRLKIRYTHYDLSIMIGSVRVTVSKLLHKLCEQNMLRVVNRQIQINVETYNAYMQQFFNQY